MTIAKTPSANNGARSKILRALYQHGMMTITELSEHCGLNGKQARDNVGAARVENLLSTERDDVTRLCAYKITASGRKWIEERPNLLKGEPDTVTEPDEESLAVESSQIQVLSPPVDPIELDDASRLSISPDMASPPILPADAGDATIYASNGLGRGTLLICQTLEEAIAQAKQTSEHHKLESSVYRLVKIGETRTTIEFVEEPA